MTTEAWRPRELYCCCSRDLSPNIKFKIKFSKNFKIKILKICFTSRILAQTSRAKFHGSQRETAGLSHNRWFYIWIHIEWRRTVVVSRQILEATSLGGKVTILWHQEATLSPTVPIASLAQPWLDLIFHHFICWWCRCWVCFHRICVNQMF